MGIYQNFLSHVTVISTEAPIPSPSRQGLQELKSRLRDFDPATPAVAEPRAAIIELSPFSGVVTGGQFYVKVDTIQYGPFDHDAEAGTLQALIPNVVVTNGPLTAQAFQLDFSDEARHKVEVVDLNLSGDGEVASATMPTEAGSLSFQAPGAGTTYNGFDFQLQVGPPTVSYSEPAFTINFDPEGETSQAAIEYQNDVLVFDAQEAGASNNDVDFVLEAAEIPGVVFNGGVYTLRYNEGSKASATFDTETGAITFEAKNTGEDENNVQFNLLKGSPAGISYSLDTFDVTFSGEGVTASGDNGDGASLQGGTETEYAVGVHDTVQGELTYTANELGTGVNDLFIWLWVATSGEPGVSWLDYANQYRIKVLRDTTTLSELAQVFNDTVAANPSWPQVTCQVTDGLATTHDDLQTFTTQAFDDNPAWPQFECAASGTTLTDADAGLTVTSMGGADPTPAAQLKTEFEGVISTEPTWPAFDCAVNGSYHELTVTSEGGRDATTHESIEALFNAELSAHPLWPQFTMSQTGGSDPLTSDDSQVQTSSGGTNTHGMGAVTTLQEGQTYRHGWDILASLDLIQAPPPQGDSLSKEDMLPGRLPNSRNKPGASLLNVLIDQIAIDENNTELQSQLRSIFNL